MQFSVIYTVDVPREVSLKPYLPTQRHLFQQTEGDGQYEFGYLEGCWTKGKHRKLCALLTKEQFKRFIDDTGLFAEDIETMGSLGAPGCGFGVPAVSFRNDDPESIQSAYVTPLPDVEPKGAVTPERSERYWKMVRRAVLNMFGTYGPTDRRYQPIFGED